MEIKQEITDLAARIRVLEDHGAIRAIIAAYGPAADRGDAQAAAALWQEDGIYDVGSFGVSTGRTAIEALLEGSAHCELVSGGAAHVFSPVNIALHGDQAIATGYSCVFRWTGTEFIVHRIAANRWTLARGQAGWRVASRVNRLLDGAAAARALLAPT